MPRRRRGPLEECPYHVFNRAVRRATLFENDAEYAEFEDILGQVLQRDPNRVLAYSAIRTHWHLVVWPSDRTALPRFMHRLTLRDALRWHRNRGTAGTGPVYQGRYKAVPIDSDENLLNALRYVERNALAAGIVGRAEDWRWCSLWRRIHHRGAPILSDWPFPVPSDWLVSINRP